MRRERPFLALAAAETLSLSGTRLSTIAIPWLVLSTTGSPVLTGLTAMMEMLPYVVAKALGGPLIDRVGPKRIAVCCDFASVAVVALVPLLDFFGLLGMLVGQGIVHVTGWRASTGYRFLDSMAMAVIGAILVVLLARFIA